MPIATTLSSCAPSTDYYLKYLDFDKISSDSNKNWTWNDMSSPNVSLKKLLYGTKKFHNGNYAIMLGTPTVTNGFTSDSYNWLFGSYAVSSYDISNDYINSSSPLMNAWQYSKSSDKMTKISNGVGFVSLMDLWKGGNDKPVISPYAKWTEEQYDYYHKYHKDEKVPYGLSCKKNEWIRNDDGAKLFRYYVTQISTLFPDFDSKFLTDLSSSDKWGIIVDSSTSCVSNAPYFIFWKDGKPVGAKTISSNNIDDMNNYLDELYGDSSDTTK